MYRMPQFPAPGFMGQDLIGLLGQLQNLPPQYSPPQSMPHPADSPQAYIPRNFPFQPEDQQPQPSPPMMQRQMGPASLAGQAEGPMAFDQSHDMLDPTLKRFLTGGGYREMDAGQQAAAGLSRQIPRLNQQNMSPDQLDDPNAAWNMPEAMPPTAAPDFSRLQQSFQDPLRQAAEPPQSRPIQAQIPDRAQQVEQMIERISSAPRQVGPASMDPVASGMSQRMTPEAQAIVDGSWRQNPLGYDMPGPSAPPDPQPFVPDAHNQALDAGYTGGVARRGGNMSLGLGDAMSSGRGFGPDVSMGGRQAPAQQDSGFTPELLQRLATAEANQRERERVREIVDTRNYVEGQPRGVVGQSNSGMYKGRPVSEYGNDQIGFTGSPTAKDAPVFMGTDGQPLFTNMDQKQGAVKASLVDNNLASYSPGSLGIGSDRQKQAAAEADARRMRIAMNQDARAGVNPLLRMMQNADGNTNPMIAAQVFGPDAGRFAVAENNRRSNEQMNRDNNKNSLTQTALGAENPVLALRAMEALGQPGGTKNLIAEQERIARNTALREAAPRDRVAALIGDVASNPQTLQQSMQELGLSQSDLLALHNETNPRNGGGIWDTRTDAQKEADLKLHNALGAIIGTSNQSDSPKPTVWSNIAARMQGNPWMRGAMRGSSRAATAAAAPTQAPDAPQAETQSQRNDQTYADPTGTKALIAYVQSLLPGY